MRDANVLKHVHAVASVSGGSILAAHMVRNWHKYTGSAEEFDEAADEILSFIRSDPRGNIALMIPILTPLRMLLVLPRNICHAVGFLHGIERRLNVWLDSVTLTGELKRRFEKLFGQDTLPGGLGSTRPTVQSPDLHILATNLNKASLASFSRVGFQSDINDPDDVPVAGNLISVSRAVAASAAFPVFFAAVILRRERFDWSLKQLPFEWQYLIDAGVYDNTAVSWFLRDHVPCPHSHIVASDATGTVSWESTARMGFGFGTAFRTIDILMRRARDTVLKSAHKTWTQTPKFVNVSIEHVCKPPCLLVQEIQEKLPSIRTDLDVFNEVEVSALIQHGYQCGLEQLASAFPQSCKQTDRPPSLVKSLVQDPRKTNGLLKAGARRALYRRWHKRYKSLVLLFVAILAALSIAWAVREVVNRHEAAWHRRSLIRQIDLARAQMPAPLVTTKIRRDSDGTVEEADPDAVRILEYFSLYDFSNWRPVSNASSGPIDPEVDSAVGMVRRVTFVKTRDANWLRLPFGTDGKDVHFDAPKGWDCRIIEAQSLDATGNPVRYRYLCVDVSQLSTGQEYSIVIRATYWNGFQEPTQTYCLVPVRSEGARVASMAIVWDFNHPISAVQRLTTPAQKFAPGGTTSAEGVYLDESNRNLAGWVIPSPQSKTDYKLQFKIQWNSTRKSNN